MFFVFSFWKQPVEIREAYLPWFAIGFFALIFAALTTTGRAGIGAGFVSRYTTATLLLPIALVHLWRLTLSGKSYLRKSRSYLLTSVFVIGFLSSNFIDGYFDGFLAARESMYSRYRGRACIELREYLEPNLFQHCITENVYPYFELFLERNLVTLEESNLMPNLFKNPDLDFEANDTLENNVTGYIDDPYTENPEGIQLSPGENIQFRGWAFYDSSKQKLPQGVVLLKGKDQSNFFAIADIQEKRPDIARLFGSEGLYSGWSVWISAQELSTTNGIISAYFYSFEEKKIFKLSREIFVTVD